MQLYRLDPLFTVRGPRPAATATDRRATAGPATDGTVRLATCCRFASAAFLASGQLVLMGPPGQAVRVLPWPSDPHLRPAALAFKPSGKRLLVVTAIGWLAVVPVRELLATPNVEAARSARWLEKEEAIFGVPAPQRSDAASWANHSKPQLWKHGAISAVSWGPSPRRSALIFTADGSFLAVRVPRLDAQRISESSPYVWCEELLSSKLPRVVTSAVPLLSSEGFSVLIETTAPAPATGSVYYQLPLQADQSALKPGTPIPLSRAGALVSVQEFRLSPVLVAADPQGKVNVWPVTRTRTPLFTYVLPPGAQSVLLAGRVIFVVLEGRVVVMSAHHAAAPSKPLQEVSLPPGAKLLCSATVLQNCALLWTTQGAFMCAPHTPPRALFFHLLNDPRSRAAADMLATALGLDLAALYEEAAERAMSAGEAGLAVELYYESDVRPAKLVARYLAIKKADVAVSYLAAALRRPASLPIPELRHMATVLLQCHAYVALAAQATIGSAPSSATDEACVAWAANSRDFDVGAALVLLRRAGLPRPFAAAARAACLTSRALAAAKGARLGRIVHALADVEQLPQTQNTRLALLLSQPLSAHSIARLRLLLPRLSVADLAVARKALLASPLPSTLDALLDISLLCRDEKPVLPPNAVLPPSAALRALGAGDRALASALFERHGDVLASAAALFKSGPPPLSSVLAAVASAPIETQAAVLLRAMKAGVATEAEISRNLTAVAPALLLLLRTNTPLPIKLSGRLCLRATQARLRAPRTDATAVPVLPARLWQAVAANAAEEATAAPRGPIVIPFYSLPPPPAAPSPKPGSAGATSTKDDPAVAFSCGHVLSRQALNEQLGLRPPPVSTLFIGYYSLRQIPLACPRCVAGLR